MLIPIKKLYEKYNLNIKGIIHIGAHDCEEQSDYINIGINNENIIWIEAMKDKVEFIKNKYPNINIYESVIDEEDDKEIVFNITNNGQSSSILEFGTHEKNHPQVYVIKKVNLKTKRLDSFIKEHNINTDNINFMNLDIQGAELNALKSMGDYLKNIDYIYTEVNTEYVYKDCCLINEIDNYLNNFGFKRVCEYIYKEYGWGDAFYIKQN